MSTKKTETRHFSIQKIYTKDISFESPNSPEIFTKKWTPKVNFDLHTHTKTLKDSLFEVLLSITVTVKCEDCIAYLIEIKQAGIFSIVNFSTTEIESTTGNFCPNILFPYAREVVSDLVAKSGFPQLILAPVNFHDLYKQNKQQKSNTSSDN